MLAFLKPTEREAALRAENDLLRAQLRAVLRMLRERVGAGPLPLTDAERGAIAERAHACGWRAVRDAVLLVSVATVRRWFRRLVEQRAAATAPKRRGPGRPPIAPRVRRLVVRLARRNPSWGYDTISDRLANLGIRVSASSVAAILRAHSVPPAIERGRRSRHWKAFVAAHWRGLAACDFLSVPVATLSGPRFVSVLVVIHLATRRIRIAAVTACPDRVIMGNVARGLAMDGGFLAEHGVTHLIHDGDGAFTKTGFTAILADRGVTTIRIPPGAPNCNAYAERVIQTIQNECTDRLIFLSDRAIRAALTVYADHYHRRRNHQGLDGAIIAPGPEVGRTHGPIRESSTLGGLLRYYYRDEPRRAV